MTPRRLATVSRADQSSPTVSIEKGSYRARPPGSRRPSPLDFSRGARGNRRATFKSHQSDAVSYRWIMLVALLLLACLGSFGIAYYLFTTRCGILGNAFIGRATNTTQVIVPQDPFPDPDPEEKYLSYLAHSGFHNQRIAFENALTLARLLNRTLIVPPIRLGNPVIRYYKFDTLTHALALSAKEGLHHCSRVPSHVPTPAECSEYHQYTLLSWSWLVNLTMISHRQRLIHRWDLRPHWIQDRLKLNHSEIFSLKDLKAYHYRFVDSPKDPDPPNVRFDKLFLIDELARDTHRLIQLGTLFGTSRLRLVHSNNFGIRGDIRRSMVFAPPQLKAVTRSIVNSLPAVFLGAHIRLGDGTFLNVAEENVRMVWWKLIHGVLGYNVNQTLALESYSQLSADRDLQVPRAISTMQRSTEQIPLDPDPSLSRLSCRSPRHTAAHLTPLNTPLYIATDAKHPANNTLLLIFKKTFPCVFFLDDFVHSLGPLDLYNEYDNVPLKPFLIPFVDAMVASHAWMVVGTQGSTFSRFAEDVLWPTFHGKDIIERG